MRSRFATKYIPVKGTKTIRINYALMGEIKKNADKIKLSKQNTKLGPIPSFNTLPGNFNYKFDDITILGTCSQACSGCYGMKGNYNFSGSVNAEAINTKLMRENMVRVFEQLKEYCIKNTPKAFRIHSNGDLLSFEEFKAWAELAIACPKTRFYCYTKEYAWIDALFTFVDVPKNFIVNISVFDGFGEREAASVFLAHLENCNIFIAEHEHRKTFYGVPVSALRCPAYKRVIRKNGTLGGVKLQHDKRDAAKYTCLWCGFCQRAGQVISTLIH